MAAPGHPRSPLAPRTPTRRPTRRHRRIAATERALLPRSAAGGPVARLLASKGAGHARTWHVGQLGPLLVLSGLVNGLRWGTVGNPKMADRYAYLGPEGTFTEAALAAF